MSREFFQERKPEVIKEEITFEEFENLSKKMENTENREVFENMVNQLKISCLRYCSARDELAIAARMRSTFTDLRIYQTEVQKRDFTRRSVHKVLVDRLNVLSRACAKFGISNEWRDQFISDEQIGDWATMRALDLKLEEKEEK